MHTLGLGTVLNLFNAAKHVNNNLKISFFCCVSTLRGWWCFLDSQEPWRQPRVWQEKEPRKEIKESLTFYIRKASFQVLLLWYCGTSTQNAIFLALDAAFDRAAPYYYYYLDPTTGALLIYLLLGLGAAPSSAILLFKLTFFQMTLTNRRFVVISCVWKEIITTAKKNFSSCGSPSLPFL